MDQATIDLHESTAWTKQVVSAWSGIAFGNLRVSQKLSSPPFPDTRELLRQALNRHFAARRPAFRAISRSRWEASVSAQTRISGVRDLCHANR